MRKGERRRSVFKKRKSVGSCKLACDVSKDTYQCNVESEANSEVGLGLGQVSVEAEVSVVL